MAKLVEIHLLKNFAPSNLNRDITGAPKSCYFGGVERGRISSQSLKRSIRFSEYMKSCYDNGMLGTRTREVHLLVLDELKSRGNFDYTPYEDDIEDLMQLEKKDKKKKKNNSKKESDEKLNKEKQKKVIRLYSKEDIIAIADVIEKNYINGIFDIDLEEELSQTVSVRPISLDIALFGRMATDNRFSNVEASVQMAHAISTHQVLVESDFFIATDDLEKRLSNLGAAHLSDFDYNSCCYYMYTNLDLNLLESNLKNNTSIEDMKLYIQDVVGSYIKAFCYTNPSAKQNAMASSPLPSLVLVEVKDINIPLSYSDAFVKPVIQNKGKDLVSSSVDSLSNYLSLVDESFDFDSKKFWFTFNVDSSSPDINNLNSYNNLNNLINDVLENL